ncbi:hypothetical protein V8G54_010875, partial [Vigna mungo]
NHRYTERNDDSLGDSTDESSQPRAKQTHRSVIPQMNHLDTGRNDDLLGDSTDESSQPRVQQTHRSVIPLSNHLYLERNDDLLGDSTNKSTSTTKLLDRRRESLVIAFDLAVHTTT